MASAFLIDANILVYALDHQDLGKQARAEEVLDALRTYESGAVSTQTLAEFVAVSTRRIKDPLTPALAYRALAGYAEAYRVCEITLPIVLEAARAARDHQMSYWDAQVWATAKLNQIPCVLSEDLQGWRQLEGVRFLNPFSEEFDLSRLA